MPMRERLQLAHALAARHGHHDPGTDWRPLLRYAAGNPLTITVLVGQALRDHLTTTADIEAFVARIRAGEADLEAGEDAALGRARSLAASLSYGFTHAFTAAERAQLAVLHLFRDTVDADALRLMGDPGIAGEDAVPQLAGLTREAAVGLLDRAAAIGLLSPLGGGYYQIHPALPWYFTTLYATADRPARQPRRPAGRPRLHPHPRRARRLLPRPARNRPRRYGAGAAGRGGQPAPRPDPGPGRRALGRRDRLPAGPAHLV